MDASWRITAVLAGRSTSRGGTRVAAKAAAADARGAPGTAPGPGLPVPVDPAPAAARGFSRTQLSAAFITQLAVNRVGDESGERRRHRDPQSVAPRADDAYRSAARRTSDLEPGFLVRRDV